MKITQRSDLKTPYLQPDLLPVSDFVRYCREQGVDTDEEELEYFDKESLLVPAARVEVGMVEYKSVYAWFNGRKEWRKVPAEELNYANHFEKVAKKTYYGRGSLIRTAPLKNLLAGTHFDNEGWLDWYEERGWLHFPAEEGYRQWMQFAGDIAFATKPDGFNEVSEMLYAKQQVYPLRLVKQSRTITVSNQALFRTPAEWRKGGMKITEMFTNGISAEEIRKQVVKWSKHLQLLCEVRDIRRGKIKSLVENYLKTKAAFGEEEALQDAADEADHYEEDNDIKGVVADILRRNGYTMQDVEDIRFQIMQLGSFASGYGDKSRRRYIVRLTDDDLNNTEDSYALANTLCWFINFAGGSGVTVKQILLRERQSLCVICGKAFDPKKKTQKTCSPECSVKNSLQTKKLARQQGRYKS